MTIFTVDAVITSSNEVRSLFGFSRSYFHADLPAVGATVKFLKSIMPVKPVDELYSVLGRAKQGKTERYRQIYKHQTTPATMRSFMPRGSAAWS